MSLTWKINSTKVLWVIFSIIHKFYCIFYTEELRIKNWLNDSCQNVYFSEASLLAFFSYLHFLLLCEILPSVSNNLNLNIFVNCLNISCIL